MVGVRVLGREHPRYHGIGLHVEDEVRVDAAVLVRKQACSERVFRGVNRDSGKDADSSGQGRAGQRKPGSN